MTSERATIAAVWAERLGEWRASGLSGAAWCRERQVSYATFGYWRRRLAPVAAGRDAFVAVTAGDASEADAASSGVRVVLGEGVELVLARQFDAGCLVRAVAALRGGSCSA